MSVSREQADAMGKLMRALDGVSESGSTPKKDSSLNQILEAFKSATDEAIDDAATSSNRDVQLAISTQPTDKGVRVGSWEIAVRVEEGFGKRYDICHTITKEPIASDLRLYDAAYGIVKALNEGETFTSSKIKTIIDLENDYARALSDAVNFASRMKITEGMKHDVAEARYGEARRQALSAKTAIQKLIK